jgi:hypothetical protein
MADPNDPVLASSCLDFLLIELVPLAQRIADQIHVRDTALREEFAKSLIFNKPNQSTTTGAQSTPQRHSTTTTTNASATETEATTGMPGYQDTEERKEAIYNRLDRMGYRVGQGLAER